MIALYGTQLRYESEVMIRGFCRDSAAVFLLPDSPETEMLRRTFACTIYHAIGLSLLREAVRNGQKLASVLEKNTGDVCLILIYMRGITAGVWHTNQYVLSEGETYPYVKLRESGPMDAGDKLSIHLPSSIFDARIDGAERNTGFRFFQKQNGKTQSLPGCDMLMLKRLCMRGAEQGLKETLKMCGEGFLR